jgi:hypothetical protein
MPRIVDDLRKNVAGAPEYAQARPIARSPHSRAHSLFPPFPSQLFFFS